MTGTPIDLLRLLVPRALGAPAGRLTPGQIQGSDFASLLKRAGKGEVSSGREVTIDEKAGVELTPEQLSRLSAAADKAEAEGATRAIALIDGMALRLDVTLREVTGPADLSGGAVLTGMDAVVSVPPAPGAAGAQTLPMPGTGAASMNPALLRALMRNGQGE